MDFTDKFNTPLDRGDEEKFQGWLVKQQSLGGRDMSGDVADYDLRGWWKKNDGADTGDGHLTDEFKKPNHPTFSDESKYNGRSFKGGRWGKDGEQWTFTPGETNLQMHGDQGLADYFSRYEPNTKLIIESPAASTIAGGAL